MPGFSSPGILFLNTWDAPERAFCRQVFAALRERGYTRYVEPCAGGFAMPLVAVNAGWQPSEMEASDVTLFTAIVGTLLSGGDFADLDVRLDGEPADLPGTGPADQAAHLLWLQLLARMQAKPDVEYWRQITGDLVANADEHRRDIRHRLDGMTSRLSGLSYRSVDMWTHLDEVADDPRTVVNANPPTYRGGFEKFFDTGGRLTWAEPDYEPFDPVPGTQRLTDMMADKPALLLYLQQREPGGATDTPVFGRHLALGQYVYLNSNRPDEVFAITGGPKVAPKRSGELTPADLPILDHDHEVTEQSRVDVVQVKAAVADYYRNLWMHRLAADPGAMNLLVVLDGHAAGVIGYSTDTMVNSFHGSWDRHLLLRFAFGAPHDTLRITRLVTTVALQKHTAETVLTSSNSIYLAAAEGLVTVEITRHPEIKGLRGLMQLASRVDHPDGHKLVYQAPWSHKPYAQVLDEFLTKEERWRKARKASK